MTLAVCTNCGELKHGAWCSCAACDSVGLDSEVSILLSDHNLSDVELQRIGDAVAVIHNTGLDEEKRFDLLVYYLSRKWSKLLEYDTDALGPEVQSELDVLFDAKLARLPGQEEPNLRVSPIRQQEWTKAMGTTYQDEDDEWQTEVGDILFDGMDVAKRIVSLNIEAGEGAVLQRLTHVLRTLRQSCDYRRMAARAMELIGDAQSYQRTVNTFCSRMKNGWSDRTKEQAAYCRGFCQRLQEMADNLKTVIEHKAGMNRLINMDFKRVRQDFALSYKTLVELSYVIMDPTRINSDGTCRIG